MNDFVNDNNINRICLPNIHAGQTRDLFKIRFDEIEG